MLLGPVFRAELVGTSRRVRYYVLRLLYGSALLLLIWSRYGGLVAMQERITGDGASRAFLLSQLASFALQTFWYFAVVQLLTLLVLIPALFGGVIADEKERKTIHYLMACRLSSGEIVLDKVLARLLHVGVFVLLGLPILCLLTLFGGIPWQYIVAAYAGTLSSVYFAAALTTLVSTLVRRVRQGVLIAYLLVFGWLVGPFILDGACRELYPNAYVWFAPVSGWFVSSSPVSLLVPPTPPQARLARMAPITASRPISGPTPAQARLARMGPPSLLEPFLWMVGTQVVGGTAFLLLAMHQLRPAFRRQETGTRRLTWFNPKRPRSPRLSRPACGSDAMLWKECHFARTDVFTKLVVLPATILLTVFLLLGSGVDEWIWKSLKEIYETGYLGGTNARVRLNASLRQLTPIYVGLWLLAVAGASASSLAVERDEDTWISLTSTPLSSWEILRGKMIGAVWGLRGFGGLLGLFWIVGLLLGALSPLRVLASLLLVAIFTWSVAALGTYASLTARSTSRAITSTLVILLAVNGGYLVIVDLLLKIVWASGHRHLYSLACTPYLTSLPLAVADPSSDPSRIFNVYYDRLVLLDLSTWALAMLVVCAHLVAAVVLTIHANRRFDVVLDRPR